VTLEGGLIRTLAIRSEHDITGHLPHLKGESQAPRRSLQKAIVVAPIRNCGVIHLTCRSPPCLMLLSKNASAAPASSRVRLLLEAEVQDVVYAVRYIKVHEELQIPLNSSICDSPSDHAIQSSPTISKEVWYSTRPFTSADGFCSHSKSGTVSPSPTNHNLAEIEYLPPYKSEKNPHSQGPILHGAVYSREDDSFSTAYSALLEHFPQYAQTYDLDTLREREFGRLRDARTVYMDYMGACLYPDFLVREHLQALTHQLIGNTHSDSPSYVSSHVRFRLILRPIVFIVRHCLRNTSPPPARRYFPFSTLLPRITSVSSHPIARGHSSSWESRSPSTPQVDSSWQRTAIIV
jgi:hypothetical protein